MESISQSAFQSYRGLVYETQGFKIFFRQMTPLLEIAGLKIGSRPASRTTSDRIEDLRAIPWVFNWAQARVMLPGWYGVGQALHSFEDQGLLRDTLDAWPFFRTTLLTRWQQRCAIAAEHGHADVVTSGFCSGIERGRCGAR